MNDLSAPHDGQHDPLLLTRFFLPRLPISRVSRPRLLARLNVGLQVPFVLVSASAGMGKTLLISEWVQQADGLRSCWLALEPSDNDWTRFFRYLVAAWQRIFPQAGSTALADLEPTRYPQPERLLNILLNDLMLGQENAAGGQSILVLDDYHRIENITIHETISYLVDHLPPGCHVVVVTRTDPPLPLSRWRSLGKMLELRANDLRFYSDETEALLNETAGLNLSTDQVKILEMRTEGWVVGLQLAALFWITW